MKKNNTSTAGSSRTSTKRWSKPLGVACATFLSSGPGVFASCGAAQLSMVQRFKTLRAGKNALTG